MRDVDTTGDWERLHHPDWNWGWLSSSESQAVPPDSTLMIGRTPQKMRRPAAEGASQAGDSQRERVPKWGAERGDGRGRGAPVAPKLAEKVVSFFRLNWHRRRGQARPMPPNRVGSIVRGIETHVRKTSRSSPDTPKPILLARTGHIHIGYLRCMGNSGEIDTTTCPKNSSQLRAQVSMTQAGIGKPVARTGGAHLRRFATLASLHRTRPNMAVAGRIGRRSR